MLSDRDVGEHINGEETTRTGWNTVENSRLSIVGARRKLVNGRLETETDPFLLRQVAHSSIPKNNRSLCATPTDFIWYFAKESFRKCLIQHILLQI